MDILSLNKDPDIRILHTLEVELERRMTLQSLGYHGRVIYTLNVKPTRGVIERGRLNTLYIQYIMISLWTYLEIYCHLVKFSFNEGRESESQGTY